MKNLIIILLAATLAACASIGRPEGGARDEKPPVFVRSTPPQGSLNVKNRKIELYFDENIQLDDAFNKVIVSPAQTQAPVVRSLGKRITVELRDTLQPDATYSIDFGDAIKDLNEGNILDGFAMDFSTGNHMDSLRISGVVMEARTLEPAQGMLVGIYSGTADSTITTMPLERVTRTNSRGQFTVRGLKPGTYNVYAINDVNRDNRWDRSEDIAFKDLTFSPSAVAIQVNDTLRSSTDLDSVVTRSGVAYLPDNVLLTWFNTGYTSHYLKETARPDRRRVTVNLSAPWTTPPSATIVNTPALEGMDWNAGTIADINATNDTVTWWIKNPAILNTDSLSLAVTYPRTDSLEQVVMKTDTLKFFYRPTQDEIKKNKELEKIRKQYPDSVIDNTEFMGIRILTSTSHDVYNPVMLESLTPWDKIDTEKIKFETAQDTLWQPLPLPSFDTVPGSGILRRNLTFNPEPGHKYRLVADSAAFHDIYGNPSKAISHEFTVKELDQYSTVIFTLSPQDTTAVVELLDSSDKPVRTARALADGQVIFRYLTPGTYYARMYFDDNGDGTWTTGSITPRSQPEETAYYPGKIEARANWDIDLPWDIYATAIDLQKPYAILKNKPKLKKGERAPGQEEQEYDEWGNPVDNTRNNSRRGHNSTPGFGGLPGGLQTTGNGNRAGNLRR